MPYIPPEPPNHRDLTHWLYKELHTNANGYYAQRIRTLLGSSDPIDKARATLAWIFLVKDRAKWDPKHRIQEELLDKSIVLRHSEGYRWYEFSVPGSIHYSFVGRAAGFSGFALGPKQPVRNRGQLDFVRRISVAPDAGSWPLSIVHNSAT